MLDPLFLDILTSCMVIVALGRLLIMRTVKEQAAQARAAGLKRFIADRPCRHGHMERRADDKGTCIVCHYLRHSLRIVRSFSSATVAY